MPGYSATGVGRQNQDRIAITQHCRRVGDKRPTIQIGNVTLGQFAVAHTAFGEPGEANREQCQHFTESAGSSIGPGDAGSLPRDPKQFDGDDHYISVFVKHSTLIGTNATGPVLPLNCRQHAKQRHKCWRCCHESPDSQKELVT
jgi:hypothetical protein